MTDITRQSPHGGLASSSILELVERAVSWWLGELRAMVPSSLLARAPSRLKCPLDIYLDRSGSVLVKTAAGETLFSPGEDEACAAHLADAAGGRQLKVRLDIPRSLCLLRSSTIPKRALRSARQIMAVETAENTPLSPADTHWDWYVEGEDPATGSLLVRQVLVGRDRIATACGLIGRSGLELARLTVGHGEARPLPVDLLVEQEPGFRGFLRSFSWPARILWAGSLLLAAALPSLLNDRADRQLAELQTARADAMAQLQSLPVREPDAIGMAAELRAVPSMATVLDGISARLPEQAVLQAVSHSAGILTLKIASGSVEATRQSLALDPLFEPAPGSDPGTLVFMLKSQEVRP
jgi:hypothetical protein